MVALGDKPQVVRDGPSGKTRVTRGSTTRTYRGGEIAIIKVHRMRSGHITGATGKIQTRQAGGKFGPARPGTSTLLEEEYRHLGAWPLQPEIDHLQIRSP